MILGVVKCQLPFPQTDGVAYWNHINDIFQQISYDVGTLTTGTENLLSQVNEQIL